MRTIRFSAIGRRDLVSIDLTSEATWGAVQRDRYVRAIEDRIKQLRERPELGPVFTASRPGLRRIRSGRHIVFYRVTDERITIVRILHEAMDLERHIPPRP